MFQVWDNRTSSHHLPECVSRHAYLDEAERSCLNDRGRLLTIYDGMDRVAGMFRDGKRVTDEYVARERIVDGIRPTTWKTCRIESPDGYACTERIYSGQRMHTAPHIAEGRAEGESDSVVATWPVRPGDADRHLGARAAAADACRVLHERGAYRNRWADAYRLLVAQGAIEGGTYERVLVESLASANRGERLTDDEIAERVRAVTGQPASIS